jgi:hypothetical protein
MTAYFLPDVKNMTHFSIRILRSCLYQWGKHTYHLYTSLSFAEKPLRRLREVFPQETSIMPLWQVSRSALDKE